MYVYCLATYIAWCEGKSLCSYCEAYNFRQLVIIRAVCCYFDLLINLDDQILRITIKEKRVKI